MPKYLAINYLANALQQRRCAVLRMVLATPHQPAECVESSLFKNSTGYHNTPWQKEHPLKITKKDALEYLKEITPSSHEMEPFSPSLQESDIVPSSNPDSPSVSFDLWSDIEEELTSHVVEALAPEKVELTKQEFPSSCEEVKHMLLEDTESVEHFQDILKRLPGLNRLCSRFKIKLIQDPFLDDSGKPLSEHDVLRNDRCCNMEEKQIWSAERWGKENFLKLPSEISKENDLPLQTWEIEQPADTIPFTEIKDQIHLRELEKLLGLNKEDTSQDLQMETLAATKNRQEVILAPDFRVEDETTAEKRQQNFVKLNDAGYLTKEEALCVNMDRQLESPSSGPMHVTTPPDTRLQRTVGNLADLKMSPAENSRVLTPGAFEKCLNNMRESEKVLSEVHTRTLAGIFLVPDTSGNNGPSTSSIQSALQSLSQLNNEDIGGSLETDLAWDPLACSSLEMDKTETRVRQLVSLQGARRLPTSSPAFQEVFQRRSPKGVIAGPLPDTVVSLPISKVPDSGVVSRRNQPGTLLVKMKDVNELKDMCSSTHQNNTTCQSEESDIKREAKSKVIKQDQSETERWSSGLDEFLFLRTATHRSPSALKPPKTIVQAAKVRPCPAATVTKETKPKENRVIPTLEVLDMQLPDEFQEVLQTIHGYAEPLLSRLKESGVVSVGKDLATLNVDFTRFLVKQAEMAIADQSDKDDTEEKQEYVMVVCLHALVTAADLLLNCGLTAAVVHLSQTQEKHAKSIGDALEYARRYLFKVHFHFQQARLLHPKLSTLLRTVGQWKQSHPEEQGRARVLLLLHRYPEQLYKEIGEALTTLPSVRFALFNAKGGPNIMELLENQDVVMTALSSITAGFPWREFDYVVEYEHKSGATREDLYTDNSRLKQHLALRSCSSGDVDAIKIIPEKEKIMPDNQEQYVFIGGQKITRDVKLLQLLESRYNVLIYERDYSALIHENTEEFLKQMDLQPDLTIDERTCVVLQGLVELETQGEFDKLKDAVLAMSLKCQKCYVILYSEQASDSVFTARISQHVSRLFASTAHFTGFRAEFKVKVLFSFTADTTAKLIRSIGDLARNDSTVWERQEWTKRKWLTDEMSAHERVLLSFPCMNSFSAQILLTAAPLYQLLRMSLGELKQTCPWIPESTLNAFHRTVNWRYSGGQDAPVQMRSTKTSLPDSRPSATLAPQSAHDVSYEGNLASKVERFDNDSSSRTFKSDWPVASEGRQETFWRDASTNSKLHADHEPEEWPGKSCGFTENVGLTRNTSEVQQEYREARASSSVQLEQANFEKNQDFEALFRNVSEQNKEQTSHELRQNKITEISEATETPGLRTQGESNELESLVENGSNRTRRGSLTSGKEHFGNCTRQTEHPPAPVNRLQLRTSHGQVRYGDVSSTQLKNLIGDSRRELDDLRVQRIEPSGHHVMKRPQQRPPRMERPVQPLKRKDWRALVNEDLQRCIQGEEEPYEDADYARPVYKQRYTRNQMETQITGRGARLTAADPVGNESTWENGYRRHEHRAAARPAAYSDQRSQTRVLHLNEAAIRHPPRVQGPYSNVGVAQPLRRDSSATKSTGQSFSQPGKTTQPNYRAVQSGHKRFSRGIMQPVYDKAMAWTGERTVPSLGSTSPEGQADELSIFPSLSDQFSFKRRKLIYEKIPGDESGQTRLFFQDK